MGKRNKKNSPRSKPMPLREFLESTDASPAPQPALRLGPAAAGNEAPVGNAAPVKNGLGVPAVVDVGDSSSQAALQNEAPVSNADPVKNRVGVPAVVDVGDSSSAPQAAQQNEAPVSNAAPVKNVVGVPAVVDDVSPDGDGNSQGADPLEQTIPSPMDPIYTGPPLGDRFGVIGSGRTGQGSNRQKN